VGCRVSRAPEYQCGFSRQARRLGTSEADLLRDYPTLTVQDLANAWNFVRSHRAEIDAQIEANEKDEE
jgi:hypothetical protein